MTSFDLETPADIHPELGVLFAALEDGTREWLGEIGEPDIETVCWQPAPGSYSIGGLMLHLCEAEIWWLKTVGLGREMTKDELTLYMSEQIEQYEGQWPAPPAKPFSWYLELYRDVRRQSLGFVRELNDPGKLYQRGEHEFSYRWILAHLVQHDSYHGGQVVMLAQLKQRIQG